MKTLRRSVLTASADSAQQLIVANSTERGGPFSFEFSRHNFMFNLVCLLFHPAEELESRPKLLRSTAVAPVAAITAAAEIFLYVAAVATVYIDVAAA
jgi:hypothetical protein